MRIQQAIDDHVVGIASGAQEGARVGHNGIYAGVAVGMFGMIVLPNHEDCRVDLNRIHVLCTGAQGRSHVVARASANDSHILGMAKNPVRHLVVIAGVG